MADLLQSELDEGSVIFIKLNYIYSLLLNKLAKSYCKYSV